MSLSRGMAIAVPVTVISAVAATAVALAAHPDGPGSAPACRTSAATAGYRVRVCITAPFARAAVTGKVPVSGTVQLLGAAPPLNGMQYTLDGKNMLFAGQAPYTFTMHTYVSTPGAHILGASAAFSGGYRTPATTVKLTFGRAAPPVTAPFTPTSGTSPPAGQPLVLAAAGGGATGMTSSQQVTNLIGSWNPNLFMYLGGVAQSSTPEEFLNWYGESGSYFSRFRSITDPVIGNNEYSSSPTAEPYFSYWGNPPHYYSVNTHGWHIVSLDDTGGFAQGAVDSAQYQWLQHDLAANTSRCTLVAFQRPIFSRNASDEAAGYAGYWQLLNRYRVSLVLNGGSHNFQQWKPLDASGVVSRTGVHEFVVGTGGDWINPFTSGDARVSAAFDTTTTAWGALKLGLSPAGASYQFQAVSGLTQDFGTFSCQGLADSTAPTAPTALAAKAPTGNAVHLAWTAATDNVGVASYQVLRDGVPVGTTAGYQTTFSDTTSEAATTYSYTVIAKDAAGNRSAPSTPAGLTTPAPGPTYMQGDAVGTGSRVPAIRVALAKPVRAGDLLVGWFGQYDASGPVRVSDSLGGAWTRGQGETYSSGAGDIALYYTRAKSAAPAGVTVTVAASSPTYLQAAVGDYWGTAVAGVLVTSALGKGSGTTADSGATPAVPGGSLVFAGLLTGGAPGTVTPGRTNGVPLVTRTSIASRAIVAADATLAAPGVQRADFALSAPTDWHAGTAVFRAASVSDTTPPDQPTGVTAIAPRNSPVQVGWLPASDDVGVVGYTVYRDGVALGDTGEGQLSFIDKTAAHATSYAYTVLAYDAAGNRSEVSAPATVTTLPAGASYVQSGVLATGGRVTAATVPLPKAVRAGDVLVGWFGQYDALGQVQVSDDVNGAWTRVQGETFSSGNGDIALYSVRSAAAPNGLTVKVAAARATYLQGVAGDYGGTASPGALTASAASSGSSGLADSGLTTPVPAGALVVTGLMTGGNPGSGQPGHSADGVPVVRAATASGSVSLADVLNAGAGAQDATFTLATPTDWYAVCAVFGP
jgi:chitodextrinase